MSGGRNGGPPDVTAASAVASARPGGAALREGCRAFCLCDMVAGQPRESVLARRLAGGMLVSCGGSGWCRVAGRVGVVWRRCDSVSRARWSRTRHVSAASGGRLRECRALRGKHAFRPGSRRTFRAMRGKHALRAISGVVVPPYRQRPAVLRSWRSYGGLEVGLVQCDEHEQRDRSDDGRTRNRDGTSGAGAEVQAVVEAGLPFKESVRPC